MIAGLTCSRDGWLQVGSDRWPSLETWALKVCLRLLGQSAYLQWQLGRSESSLVGVDLLQAAAHKRSRTSIRQLLTSLTPSPSPPPPATGKKPPPASESFASPSLPLGHDHPANGKSKEKKKSAPPKVQARKSASPLQAAGRDEEDTGSVMDAPEDNSSDDPSVRPSALEAEEAAQANDPADDPEEGDNDEEEEEEAAQRPSPRKAAAPAAPAPSLRTQQPGHKRAASAADPWAVLPEKHAAAKNSRIAGTVGSFRSHPSPFSASSSANPRPAGADDAAAPARSLRDSSSSTLPATPLHKPTPPGTKRDKLRLTSVVFLCSPSLYSAVETRGPHPPSR
jgi:hypothetical protein